MPERTLLLPSCSSS